MNKKKKMKKWPMKVSPFLQDGFQLAVYINDVRTTLFDWLSSVKYRFLVSPYRSVRDAHVVINAF